MTHLPFSGLISFARAPILDLAADFRADVGVLGLPFDIALGFRPGARFAPRAIREASLRYALPPEGFYDLRTGQRKLAGLQLVDAGDVILPSLEPELARNRITEAAQQLKSRVKLPIFLGGDHSVSYPLLRAFSDVKDLHIVQLDAHLDFTDVRNDTRFSNSSPFRRACEDLPNLKHITTIGLRGLRFDEEAVQAAKSRGHALVGMWDCADLEKVIQQLPEGKNVYLSFDVDVLDPAVLPATSSPEVDGMSYATAMTLIRETVKRNTLVGLDVVELTPALDASGNSNLLIARLIMETLTEVFS
ncbi:arginase family protein [Deinococcus roseus]|uniref:Agmatinase n=1 Tax=Deinococcus roseus TaxID=392414 RepID=A0ABQ2CVT0_9DEIO|nr:arginase family protein [Deinococcus roseus]GGJ25694.1 agmatinase [Deinococcus roseus]